MRLLHETAHSFGEPVIPPRLPTPGVHALLHDRPRAVVRDDEAVQVEIEAVLEERAVHLGDEPAGARQRIAVHAGALAELHKLHRRPARVTPAAAADGQADFALASGEPALERAEHAGGDSARVPVHSHHAPESLEPERVREAAQDAVRTFLEHERLDHHSAEARHARGEPVGHASAVQGKECAAGATHTGVQYNSAAEPARAAEAECARRFGADRIRTDASQLAGGAFGARPDRLEQRLHAVDGLEILGAEADLEVAPAFAFGAETGAGEVGAAGVDPGAVDHHRLEVDARTDFQRQAAGGEAAPLLE